ncbi:hypothetical protein ACLOJK_032805 [Asimina triloba]
MAGHKWVLAVAGYDHMGMDLAEFAGIGNGVEEMKDGKRGREITYKVVETLHSWQKTGNTVKEDVRRAGWAFLNSDTTRLLLNELQEEWSPWDDNVRKRGGGEGDGERDGKSFERQRWEESPNPPLTSCVTPVFVYVAIQLTILQGDSVVLSSLNRGGTVENLRCWIMHQDTDRGVEGLLFAVVGKGRRVCGVQDYKSLVKTTAGLKPLPRRLKWDELGSKPKCFDLLDSQGLKELLRVIGELANLRSLDLIRTPRHFLSEQSIFPRDCTEIGHPGYGRNPQLFINYASPYSDRILTKNCATTVDSARYASCRKRMRLLETEVRERWGRDWGYHFKGGALLSIHTLEKAPQQSIKSPTMDFPKAEDEIPSAEMRFSKVGHQNDQTDKHESALRLTYDVFNYKFKSPTNRKKGEKERSRETEKKKQQQQQQRGKIKTREMDRVFSAEEISDHFWPSHASSMANSADGPNAAMNRSSSEWAFQRFLQEASAYENPPAAAAPAPPPAPPTAEPSASSTPASSSSSSSTFWSIDAPAAATSKAALSSDVAEMKALQPSGASANVPIDSNDYQAILKRRLDLACAAAAVALSRVCGLSLIFDGLCSRCDCNICRSSLQKLCGAHRTTTLDPHRHMEEKISERSLEGFLQIAPCLFASGSAQGQASPGGTQQ